MHFHSFTLNRLSITGLLTYFNTKTMKRLLLILTAVLAIGAISCSEVHTYDIIDESNVLRCEDEGCTHDHGSTRGRPIGNCPRCGEEVANDEPCCPQCGYSVEDFENCYRCNRPDWACICCEYCQNPPYSCECFCTSCGNRIKPYSLCLCNPECIACGSPLIGGICVLCEPERIPQNPPVVSGARYLQLGSANSVGFHYTMHDVPYKEQLMYTYRWSFTSSSTPPKNHIMNGQGWGCTMKFVSPDIVHLTCEVSLEGQLIYTDTLEIHIFF